MNKATTVIGVIGAGIMGGGIAQTTAAAGFRVLFYARRPESMEAAFSAIRASLTKLHEKGLITEEPSAIRARITPCHDLASLAGCNLVVEAIAEQMEPKAELLKQLDALLPKEAILATTTTSLSVTTLGVASGRADRFIGMHFMNPVPLMELVELVAGDTTSTATSDFAKEMTAELGKTFVVSKDRPGFITSRLLCTMVNEALQMLQEKVASAEEIDTAMKLGGNFPMGPLALADLIGLDVCLSAMETLSAGLDGHKYAPSLLLKEYVTLGRLGRKCGQGVYRYDGQPKNDSKARYQQDLC